MKTKTAPSPNAFTLIEVVLAMSILALVMVSVFGVLQAGTRAYENGQASMDLYQAGRVGLRKAAEELRFALSANAFWKPEDTIVMMNFEDAMAAYGGRAVQEEDPGAIRFMGEGDSVLFVRKIYQLGKNPPFDLQECRIFVEGENLVLQVERSLLAVKQATWYFQYFFKVNLSGQILPNGGEGRVRLRQLGEFGEPPLQEFIGDYGYDGRKYRLVEGAKSIKFRYTDGQGWSNSWNSQQLITINRISPNSPNFNAGQDSAMEERGPPQVVEITLTLINGDSLATAADIPAGNMQKQGMDRFYGGGDAAAGGIDPNAPPVPGRTQFETPMGGPQAGI